MAPYERINRKELNPARELERHLIAFGTTQQSIKNFRMEHSDTSVRSNLSMHDPRGRHQFADFAGAFADSIDARRDPETKMYASILAVVPNTIGAIHALEHRDELETKDYHAAIHMIEFNHALREIIETNPSIQPKIVTNLIKSATLRYGYGADAVNAIVDQTHETLYGIKHEQAFKAALFYLPEGYELVEASSEEEETILDKHGTDIRVRCPNGVIVSIDVKSSQKGVEYAKLKQQLYKQKGGQLRPHEITLYSGFTSEDFDMNSPWQPNQAAIARVVPQIEQELRRASQRKGTFARERIGR